MCDHEFKDHPSERGQRGCLRHGRAWQWRRAEFGAFPQLGRRNHSWLLFTIACFLGVASHSSRAQDLNLDTDYQNYWVVPDLGVGPFENYFDTNTQPSTAVYGGSVLEGGWSTNFLVYSNLVIHGNLVDMLPHDANGMGLYWSSIGQPAASIFSDVAIGDVISPPPGFSISNAPANFTWVQVGEQCDGLCCFAGWRRILCSRSRGSVIAAQPNNTTIVWTNASTGSNSTTDHQRQRGFHAAAFQVVLDRKSL